MRIKPGQLAAFCWIVVMGIIYLSFFPFTELISGLPGIHAFSPSFSSIEHIICLILFVISANGWGEILLPKVLLSHHERFLFATGAGFGIMSLITLLAAVLGVTGSVLYFITLLCGFVLFIIYGKGIHRLISPHQGILLLISVLALLSTLTGALAPPTQFDSLVYHLALPSKYLLAGKMHAVPENIFSSFPQGMEMLYMMAIRVDSDILANLLHWIFLPLIALAIYAFCHRVWGHETGLMASILWIFTPAVMLVSTGTYVDLALTFYYFMSVYSFFLWKETKQNWFVCLCGLFSGLACSVKYTGAINVLILSAFFIVFSYYGKDETPVNDTDEESGQSVPSNSVLAKNSSFGAFQSVLLFILIVFIVFSPWLFKNILFLKNPVAPWGAGIFQSSLVSKEKAGAYFSHISSHGLALKNVKDVLLLPWDITFFGYKYGGGFDVLGPIFLLFVPILFLRMKIDKIEKVLLFYSILFILAWIASGKVMRFLIPVTPFLGVFSARGVQWLVEDDAGKTFKRALALIIALLLAHNLIFYHWIMASVDPYSAVFGSLTRKQYLTQRVNYFNATEEILNKLGPKTKTLFLGETRSYYCRNNSLAPTYFDVNPLIANANTLSTPGELSNSLKELGVTHIFVNNFEFQRLAYAEKFNAEGAMNFKALKDRYSKMIYRDKFCELYEIAY